MPHLEFNALTLLLVQIATIVVLSRGLGVVAQKLGQPLVIAEVVAGILLGPSLLGLVAPEAMHALFPATSLDVLKMLSQFGLVLFMFLIGLELDPNLLKGRTHSSIAISHTSILVPFLLGAGAAYWLHPTHAPDGVSLLAFMLFFGAAMSVTAFPVLARILSERKLLTSHVGAVTIACAAVDDVTAWCILAFVVAVARSTGIAGALWTTTFALAYILVMLLLARPFLRRVAARVASRDGLSPTVIVITLVLLLASATVTELIGIHALFGAFLFGAIVPKEGKLAEAIAEKLEAVAVVLLLPLFFAYSGLRTEIGLVNTTDDWIVTGVIVLLATIGKFGGSAVAARMTGIGWRESSAIGILMNTRGLMELIVLNLGMDLGVISPEVFTMLVIMALVTTVATAPILRVVYPDSELRKDQATDSSTGLVRGDAAHALLMCVSTSSAGPGLVTLAKALVGDAAERARLYALHLFDPSDRPSVEKRRSATDGQVPPLGPLLVRARELGLSVRSLSFVSNDPARDIVETAEARHASLLLLGAHRPLLLGGQLSGVVSDVALSSKCPVGVLVDRGLEQVERVLVAYAGGPEDLAALEVARQIGRSSNARLTLFHVVAPGGTEQPGRGRSQIARFLLGLAHLGRDEAPLPTTVVDDLLPDADVRAGAVEVRVVEHESPPDAVLEETKRGYDLVVIGMHARWGLDGSMLSLRRRRVLAEANVSILAVHPPVTSASDEPLREEGAPRILAPAAARH